jgi:Ca2+-binding EF-hand superfamily protein
LLLPIGINLASAEFKQGDVVTQTEIPMTKHILMLTTVTFALVCGGISARAQEDSDDPAMMQHSEEVQQNQGDEEGTGRMGHGMMRQCMRQCMAEDGRMGEGWRKHDMRHGGMMGSVAMRIIFALMDPDGDGTVSLEEFQAAHARIFKAMDADKDGTVSQEEMLVFMRGRLNRDCPAER